MCVQLYVVFVGLSSRRKDEEVSVCVASCSEDLFRLTTSKMDEVKAHQGSRKKTGRARDESKLDFCLSCGLCCVFRQSVYI
jgi:hypothetical protein